jgi:hypothetical protein
MFEMKSKSVTLAFKRYFSEAGFGELTVPNFWFVCLPSWQFAINVWHLR